MCAKTKSKKSWEQKMMEGEKQRDISSTDRQGDRARAGGSGILGAEQSQEKP